MRTLNELFFVAQYLKNFSLPAAIIIFFLTSLTFIHTAYADTPAPTSLQEAYGLAPDGDVIKALNSAYEENLTTNRSVTVTLEGGIHRYYLDDPIRIHHSPGYARHR